MSITVKFTSYTPEQFQQVIDHYNTIKPVHHMAIEELNRCEGGFMIKMNDTELDQLTRFDENARIKQVRWNKGKLDSMNYTGFTEEETVRLYRSLVHVFGVSNVNLA